jgi:hypothetical protein
VVLRQLLTAERGKKILLCGLKVLGSLGLDLGLGLDVGLGSSLVGLPLALDGPSTGLALEGGLDVEVGSRLGEVALDGRFGYRGRGLARCRVRRRSEGIKGTGCGGWSRARRGGLAALGEVANVVASRGGGQRLDEVVVGHCKGVEMVVVGFFMRICG